VSLDGGATLEDLVEATGIELPDEGSHETWAGLVFDRLGRVAVLGAVVAIDGGRFEVINVDGNRIDRVPATTPQPQEHASSESP